MWRWGCLGLLALLLWGCGEGSDSQLPVDQLALAYTHPAPASDPPWDYFLTSYGGPNDSCYLGTPACGGRVVDGQWWYATGAYSFGCNSKLELRANGKCVVVDVVDNGPADWVEEKAAATCGGLGYIIDASPLVAQELFGVSSAGWSECRAIQVRPVDASTATGPSTCTSDSTPSDPPADDQSDDPDKSVPADDPPADDPATDPPADDPVVDPSPAPSTPQYPPQLSIQSRLMSIDGQTADFCQQDGAGIYDWWVGQETDALVEVKNSGQGDAYNTQIALVVAQPFLQIKSWTILSDGASGGAFFSMGDDQGQLAPQQSPGPSFVLTLAQIRPGETKQIKLRLAAQTSSAGMSQPPELRAWVAYVDGYYYKATYDGTFTNEGGYQVQNGGDLRCASPTTVLSQETCDGFDNDCNGVVDDGCSGAPVDSSGSNTPYYPEPDLPDGVQDQGQQLSGQSRQHAGMLLGQGCSLAGAGELPGLELGLWLLFLLAVERRSRKSR